MNNYTCIIVDDEQDAVDLLIARLGYLFKNIEVIGCYNNWEEALHTLRITTPDILFLDISMPEKTGMDLLKLLPDLQSEIIFTTAYSEFALEAFKFSATGYVLKPVEDTELTKAINKGIERINYKRLSKHDNENKTPKTINSKIGIPNNNGIDYINIEDIIYLEALNKYTKVVTKGNNLLSSYNIGRFKTLLKGHAFCQVHRSYIINLGCIIRYEGVGNVIMSDKTSIPVSRAAKDEFLKLFATIAKTVDSKNIEED